MKAFLSAEEVLGTDWLNKLGIIILVIGVALFLAYQLQELGPAGKVLVGYTGGAVMLAAGIFYEVRPRWQIMARAAVGGGWALLFFVTYAIHHVGATRILDSEPLDFLLLLLVAVAMVLHTLRYGSQVVTGLAFFLAFSTINISRAGVYSLLASAILAAGLVVIAQRERWFKLEVFGVLAAYLNHYYWLRPVIEPMGARVEPFAELPASATILALYWLLFRMSYVVRAVQQEDEKRVSMVSALLNTLLLLTLMKYQTQSSGLAFWFLLAVGGSEMGLGEWGRRRQRRDAFVVLSAIGTTLLVFALPFRFSGATLPILWLAESEALFLVGIFGREAVFQRLGLLTAFLVAVQLNYLALSRIFDPNWGGFQPGDFVQALVVFASTAVVFYGNAHWITRRHRESIATELEQLGLRVLSHLAGATTFVAIWLLLPEAWVAVGWIVFGLVIGMAGKRFEFNDLTVQANCLAVVAFLRAVVVNLGAVSTYGLALSLFTVSIVAVLLYLFSDRCTPLITVGTQPVSMPYAWMASALVGLAAWYGLRAASVALAWSLFGIVLFELGMARRSFSWRAQGYTAFTLSFLRMFFVNMNAAGYPGEISLRVYTTIPLALAFYYIYWRLGDRTAEFLERDRKVIKAPQLFSFFGILTFAALIRFEMPSDWIVAAWAGLILILLSVAWKTGQRIFLYQGYFLGLAVLFRAVLYNFYQRSYFPTPLWESRLLTVGTAVTLFFLALAFALRLQRRGDIVVSQQRGRLRSMWHVCSRRPELFFFFAPFFLLTVLLALESAAGMVTVAWGIEAVAVFLFALWVGQRSYRLSGLALLLLCVGKVVVLDVWGLEPDDRYLTFIVLGAALLGVSFLYTRYREIFRQYL